MVVAEGGRRKDVTSRKRRGCRRGGGGERGEVKKLNSNENKWRHPCIDFFA